MAHHDGLGPLDTRVCELLEAAGIDPQQVAYHEIYPMGYYTVVETIASDGVTVVPVFVDERDEIALTFNRWEIPQERVDEIVDAVREARRSRAFVTV